MRIGVFSLFFFVFLHLKTSACQCPTSVLSRAECNKYELIFRGKVAEVKTCDATPGTARFQVLELFKGLAEDSFTVYFNCKEECARQFVAGEEWIIYTNYRQVDNAQMDWCSRSRKYFRFDKEDYYSVLYGNDYEDELNFLRTNLGNHRLSVKKDVTHNRNDHPDTNQTIVYLLISIAGMVGFYFLLQKKRKK